MYSDGEVGVKRKMMGGGDKCMYSDGEVGVKRKMMGGGDKCMYSDGEVGVKRKMMGGGDKCIYSDEKIGVKKELVGGGGEENRENWVEVENGERGRRSLTLQNKVGKCSERGKGDGRGWGGGGGGMRSANSTFSRLHHHLQPLLFPLSRRSVS